jgi:23S rRNA (guanosine2251-2'-O)-methyltransferase
MTERALSDDRHKPEDDAGDRKPGGKRVRPDGGKPGGKRGPGPGGFGPGGYVPGGPKPGSHGGPRPGSHGGPRPGSHGGPKPGGHGPGKPAWKRPYPQATPFGGPRPAGPRPTGPRPAGPRPAGPRPAGPRRGLGFGEPQPDAAGPAPAPRPYHARPPHHGAPHHGAPPHARPSAPSPAGPYRAMPGQPGPRPPGPRPPGPRPPGRPPVHQPFGRPPVHQPFGPAPHAPAPHAPAAPAPPPAGLLGDDEELVAGRHPVEEAFAARRNAVRLLVVPQRRQALEKLVLHATNLRIPIVEVEGGTLTQLAGFDGHQGIALVTDRRRFAGVEDLVARALERHEPAFVLVLDSLEDPQNFGSLLRTAEASGVHGVVYPTRRQAPLSPAAVKASAGAVEHLLLAPVDDLAEALTDLHVRGLRIVGTDASAQLTARESDLRGPVAVVVGSEGQGLGPAVRRRCDAVVRIPMRGHIESLNAAVAGSILLYEASSQRRGDQPAVPAAEPEASEPTEPPEPTEPAEAAAEPTPRPAAPRPHKRIRKPALPATEDSEPAAAADDLLPGDTAPGGRPEAGSSD